MGREARACDWSRQFRTRFLNVPMASRMLRGLFSTYVPPMNGRRLPAFWTTFPVRNFAIYFSAYFCIFMP